MRLRTQFRLTLSLFGIILALLAASAIITNLQISKASAQERMAAAIARGANTLGYLANDYLIYHEHQQLERWQSGFASFSAQVASLRAERPEQQALVANMRVNQNRLKEVFESVASVPPGPDPAFLQVSWSRLAIQSQGLLSDASRLSQMLRQRIEQLINARTIQNYAMICLFGVFFLASYMLTYRRTFKSLAILQEGAAVIGSGNLDFVIEEIRKDEIGDLSHAFNRMTADLKKMYEEQKTYMAMLEQSNRDLEEFAHVASHDLQEPLRKIQTYADRLATMHRHSLREEARDNLDRMQRAAGRMQDLIMDLLKYSGITSKPQAFTRFNLKEAVEEAVMDLAVLRTEMDGHIQVEELPEVAANRVQMRQLFQNLISNALKYHAEQKPVVKIYSPPYPAGDFREIHIQDNGIGFDERYLDRIFKPFQRLHGKDSRFQGTGIGLAICRRIVERHGGTLTARSQPGKGATFIVRLPRG